MKVYKTNPLVLQTEYFVPTGAARTAKNEAPATRGYSVALIDGKWIVRQASYYNCSLKYDPVVAETKTSLKRVIDAAIVRAVLAAVEGGKNDETD